LACRIDYSPLFKFLTDKKIKIRGGQVEVVPKSVQVRSSIECHAVFFFVVIFCFALLRLLTPPPQQDMGDEEESEEGDEDFAPKEEEDESEEEEEGSEEASAEAGGDKKRKAGKANGEVRSLCAAGLRSAVCILG
jgi:hypothetical protein